MDKDHLDRTPDPAEQLPPEGVLGHWEAVIEDMATTAEEYREAGWKVLSLHPGDVAPVSGERSTIEGNGIELIVPGEDARRVRESVTAPDAAFDSCSVYRAVVEGIVFLVVAVEDPRREAVVLFPAYYDNDDPDTRDVFETAVRNGRIHTHVRDLSGETVSTFTHDEPELFTAPAKE